MDFGKILLVLKREYLTRVKTKSFILSTILTPVLLVAVMGLVIYLSISETEVIKKVAIVDNSGVLYSRLSETNTERYVDMSQIEVDSLKKQVLSGDIDGYLVLENATIDSAKTPTLVYSGSGGLNFLSSVRSDLRDVVREERVERSNVSQDIRDIFESRLSLDSIKLSEAGEEEKDNAIFGAMFGFILGLFIFMGVFGYGAVLMRSVIEEKTNRIVEVIASSVKPIELMLGKLFGICALAITQFGVWIASYIGISLLAAPIAAMYVSAQMDAIPSDVASGAAESGFDPAMLEQFVVDPIIFVYFFIFFFIGFMIYASIFAAIGAAVDSEQDTQQFMMPVMIPIMLAYFLNLKVMEDPDSTISTIASLVPLTAPINMISRIAATEVPFWQIALSLLLMTGTFAGFMWVAAKIYRVGILMYGKKPSYKELAKWIRQG